MVGEKINHLPEIGKSIPTKWSIEPELPGGINFNLETGRISGAPTQVLEESTHYTVTGSNQFGKGSYTFMLNIVRTDSKESSNQDQELPSVNLGYSSVEDYLSNKLRKEWHKFLIIKQNGDSLEESARKVLNKSSWEESDFDDGDMPDFENLSPYDSITYGTYLIDLWTCLYGSKDDPFNDYSGSKLLDKSLYFFTTQVLGLSARRDEEKVKKFWYKLEDDFYSIYWVRNHNAHTHPIPRARAIACQTALIKFEKLVLKPFADYISQR